MNERDISRFWSKVQVGGDDECWNWTGKPNLEGYGTARSDGKPIPAHRMAWELANGPITAGGRTEISWTCGNKMCCNPKHLIVRHKDQDSIVRRFWEKVQKAGEDDCWEWQAAKTSCGYGYFSLNGRMRLANRQAWEFTHGPIPEGEGYHGTCVLHSCDNPGCCNPKHLRLGSHQENMKERDEKDRCHPGRHGHYLYGEDHPQNKLTADQVREIKHSVGVSQRELARRFGVCHATVRNILNGNIWTQVT